VLFLSSCRHLLFQVPDWSFLVEFFCDWSFSWLLELSWGHLHLAPILLSFRSCSVDALPVTCASGHMHFLVVIAHYVMITCFLLIVLCLFYWGDLRWLSFGNSLVFSVVMATGRQSVSIGCGFSLSQLLYMFSWF